MEKEDTTIYHITVNKNTIVVLFSSALQLVSNPLFMNITDNQMFTS